MHCCRPQVKIYTTKPVDLRLKYGLSLENFGLTNTNFGSPKKRFGSQTKGLVFPMISDGSSIQIRWVSDEMVKRVSDERGFPVSDVLQ